jgi:hypothetical protein
VRPGRPRRAVRNGLVAMAAVLGLVIAYPQIAVGILSTMKQ